MCVFSRYQWHCDWVCHGSDNFRWARAAFSFPFSPPLCPFALCPLQVLGYCIRSLSHGSVSREKEFLLRNNSIDAEVLRKRKFRVLIGVEDAECLQRWGRKFICIVAGVYAVCERYWYCLDCTRGVCFSLSHHPTLQLSFWYIVSCSASVGCFLFLFLFGFMYGRSCAARIL